MGLFHLFRKKQVLSETNQKLNALWNLWAEGKVESPYQELMTYESEVNNGGHDQYFFNLCHAHECDLSKCAELQKQLSVLFSVLPDPLCQTLRKAYDAYNHIPNDHVLENCDDEFYQNESLVTAILEKYARQMK